MHFTNFSLSSLDKTLYCLSIEASELPRGPGDRGQYKCYCPEDIFGTERNIFLQAIYLNLEIYA